MADTTALKNRIRAAIKANDNQEITGPVLQQALLDIVDELDLYPELQNEANTRRNTDTQLQNAINVIKANIDNGYVYAGIAMPSTTPVSGKVFYIAMTAGTYTNFGAQVLTQGINILRYNGSTWSNQQFIGIDNEPTAESNNLVKSGGVASTYGSYVENPEFVDVKLDAEGKILWAIRTDGTIFYGAGIPPQVIDYINEKITELSLDEYEDIVAFLNDLEKGDKTLQDLLDKKVDGEYVENPEYIEIKTDAEDKILEATEKDGTKVFGGDVKVLGSINISGINYKVVNNQEWLKVVLDTEDRIICGIRTDGTFCVVNFEFLDSANNIKNKLAFFDTAYNQEFMDVELDAEDKILGGRKTDGTKFENIGFSTPKVSIGGHTMENIEDPEGRLQIGKDSENKIYNYRKKDGTLVENVGIETNHLDLTGQGMSDFQQALKDAGFNPGGCGDWSDAKSIEIPIPRCAIVNITSPSGDAVWPQAKGVNLKYYMQFYDMQGNYFKKEIIFNAQGNSSMQFAKKNGAVDICNNNGWDDDDTFSIKFGDWVAQDSFHFKSYYTDYIRGGAVIAYQVADEVYKTRGIYADRPWKKALIDFSEILPTAPAGLSEDGTDDVSLQIDNGARCMPDGFPAIFYLNGEFYGIFAWQLKKHRDNYHMNKKTAEHIHLDGDLFTSNLWGGTINWTAFEVRNPKNLYCMDGSKYDGDNPKELIDSTSQYYDSTNKDHKTTAKVKQYIINLSNRVGEINSLTPTYTRPDETVITLNNFKGSYNIDVSYARGNYIIEQQDGTRYYMSLHNTNTRHDLSDTEYWHDITEDISSIKSEIEKYFDIDNLVDYQLINMAVNDPDGFGKNWQWTTWDGVKWYVNQYDKDMALGNHHTGMFTRQPSNGGWMNNNVNLPTGLALRYYTPEHKTRWNNLVSAGILTVDNIASKINGWVARVGQYNYEKEWKKWPESPCNRDSGIDYENWRFTGGYSQSAPAGGTIWNENDNYNVGQRVWYHGTDYLEFEAIQANTNKKPLTITHDSFPTVMGYRDSMWRYIKFIGVNLQNQNNFINNL